MNLILTLQPDPGWHVYAYAPRDPKGISKPTLIAITEPADWVAGDPQPSAAPTVKSTGLSAEPEQPLSRIGGPLDGPAADSVECLARGAMRCGG